MNQVSLIGNLTRDPECGTTTTGVNYCRFCVAINRPYKKEDGTTDADFLNVITWYALAENCAKFLSKGKRVGVIGTIETRRYEKDGEARYATDIRASSVEFLSPATPAGDELTPPPAPRSNQANTQTHDGQALQAPPVEDDVLPF